jgi:cardiolipin synthase
MVAAVSRLPGNIPNLISLARLGLAPAGAWFVLEGQFAAGFWVLVIAGASDAVDGIIARWFDARTRLGALLDPVADKALLVGMILALGAVGALPLWLVLVAVGRDAVILAGASYLYLKGVPVRELAPTPAGKVSTFLQIVLTGVVLGVEGFAWPLHWLTPGLIWAVGAAAAISGIGYGWRGRRQLRERKPRP